MATTPKYGPVGWYGPAPRFPWREVRSRGDGWLPSKRSLRVNITQQAEHLNQFRAYVARKYGVRPAHVYIVPTSWVRSDAHNRRVGGKANSMHTRRRAQGYRHGCTATDFTVAVRLKTGRLVALSPPYVARLAARAVPAWRNGGIGSYPGFTHADHGDGPRRW